MTDEQRVMEKLQDIMCDMNVEVLTDTTNPTTITADTGV